MLRVDAAMPRGSDAKLCHTFLVSKVIVWINTHINTHALD